MQLEALFLSVGWESAKYPERLVRAMRGFSTVCHGAAASPWCKRGKLAA